MIQEYRFIFQYLRLKKERARYWSDFDSPSVTRMFKRAVVASEEGRMPFENEAEMPCPLLN